MKLVEILARELKEWPENINELTQSRFNNEVYVNDEDGTSLQPNVFLSVHHNEGKCYPAVTRSQWEAERARMAMDCVSAFSQEQDQAEQAVSQYEQELWDKVAVSVAPTVYADAMSEFAKTGCPCEDWRDYVASDICNMADAFMEERAKRLKGSQ